MILPKVLSAGEVFVGFDSKSDVVIYFCDGSAESGMFQGSTTTKHDEGGGEKGSIVENGRGRKRGRRSEVGSGDINNQNNQLECICRHGCS